MKPLLFNTEMTRAIRDGRKTVTRRVVKLKYLNTHLTMWTDKYGTRLIELQNEEPGATTVRNPDGTTSHKLLAAVEKTPPYRPGDILYVPEAWKCRKPPDLDDLGYEVVFRDGEIVKFHFTDKTRWKKWYKYWSEKSDNQWQSPYFMPKEAARLFLRVTDVRVERLQESFFNPGVTVLACQAEGIDIGDQCRECIENYGNPVCIDENDGDDEEECECGILDDIRAGFAGLWDSTIKPADRTLYGWEADPWVWVIEFERISKEEAL